MSIKFLLIVIYQQHSNGEPGSGTSITNCWSTTAYSNSIVNPSQINGSGNLIGYSEVTEHYKSNANNTDNIGKITYVFENHESEGILIDTNTGLITNSNWSGINGPSIELSVPLFTKNEPGNGSLNERYVYDNNDNLKQKTINTYSYERGTYCTYGVKAGTNFNKRIWCGVHGALYFPDYEHLLVAYAIGSLYTFLDSTEEISYLDGGAVNAITNYEYNDYHQVTTQEAISSTGEISETRTSYTSAIPLYEQDNFLTGVLDQSLYEDDLLIDKMEYDYNQVNVPNNFPNYTSNGKLHFINRVENPLKGKTIDLITNSNGNLVFANNHDGGPQTYYLWGYNQTKIIAKIENYEYSSSQLNAIIQAQNASDSSPLTNTLDWGLMLNLSALRSAFPNSMVTTFTHGLSGIKTITDPRGNRISITIYDDFNRLQMVKDEDGNILSTNEYNYRTQN